MDLRKSRGIERHLVDLATLVAVSFERHSPRRTLPSLQAPGFSLTVTTREQAMCSHWPHACPSFPSNTSLS